MEGWLCRRFVVGLMNAILCALISKAIAQEKGYEWVFAFPWFRFRPWLIGFLFGPFGVLAMGGLPDKNLQNKLDVLMTYPPDLVPLLMREFQVSGRSAFWWMERSRQESWARSSWWRHDDPCDVTTECPPTLGRWTPARAQGRVSQSLDR